MNAVITPQNGYIPIHSTVEDTPNCSLFPGSDLWTLVYFGRNERNPDAARASRKVDYLGLPSKLQILRADSKRDIPYICTVSKRKSLRHAKGEKIGGTANALYTFKCLLMAGKRSGILVSISVVSCAPHPFQSLGSLR